MMSPTTRALWLCEVWSSSVMVADHARIGGIGNVDDRGAEVVLVRDVPDIGVIAGDADLSGAGQVEMAEAADVAGHGWFGSLDDVQIF